MTDTEVRDEMSRRARKAARTKLAEPKLNTILVIVEGGIVQEVTTAADQMWDVWDADDFADAPVDYWDEKDPATREHIRTDWPEMYGEIIKVVRAARTADKKTARITLRKEAARAAAVENMN